MSRGFYLSLYFRAPGGVEALTRILRYGNITASHSKEEAWITLRKLWNSSNSDLTEHSQQWRVSPMS